MILSTALEIRGKSRLSKKWYYKDVLRDISFISEDGEALDPHDEIDLSSVGRFTGLYDKSGKEIYEGDITYVASEDENAFILWDTETARYIIQFEGWLADFDNFYGRDLEVIGNIYENPELLGGE